ncbi:protein arginine N-methyltransferase 7-like [Tropilaelaps mercedesae]|uniref:Protein arginine N-methyltransferase 7-like n=1 Tax=Tropilaelaps mercedesae TaxID=418985 RepID=A0A1V9XLI1_9ACAR|nr:protein arginine N-methyltransferase 7-like [Tropilaelaps mercedesae]
MFEEFEDAIEEQLYAQEIARSAFADMLHDTERNELYEKGIKWAISELRSRGVTQIVVLDIGTGSGLLSMLAARHGADVIYACDGFIPAIGAARRVIQANGFSENIKLIPKMSTDLKIGPGLDIEHRANLLVAELFDTELIGEGLIRSYADAHSRLLTDDCIMVPQTATIYSQFVDSQFLRMHHTVPKFGLTVTENVERCPGTASLQDIQLSQIDDDDFTPICEPMVTFYFDLKNILATPCTTTYRLPDDWEANCGAPCVLTWWECQMAPSVTLSCSPRWEHPKGKNQPWRDHWMQAVYYPLHVKGKWLKCVRDEFSLWFDLVDVQSERPSSPACICGVHYSLPRYRIAQLSDRSLYCVLYEAVSSSPERNILLICDGGVTLPMAIAQAFPQKSFYVHEATCRLQNLTSELLRINNVSNCVIFEKLKHVELIELIVADPFLTISPLPWVSVLALNVVVEMLGLKHVRLLPESSRLMAIEVEFENLWKIRAPIVQTVGLKMAEYDRFIQTAMKRCDSLVETQPLWEYPGVARGPPLQLSDNIHYGETIRFRRVLKGNGIALWMEYSYGKNILLNLGPVEPPREGERIRWNRFTKQGVMLDVSNLTNVIFKI